MSTYFFNKTFKRLICVLALVFALTQLLVVTTLWADNTDRKPSDPVVFIDPGHGGNDTGARGAHNLYEKDVVLALSKQIQTGRVEKDDLIFSRRDDYSVNLFQRTEIANNRKAALFISLHTGGSFRYTGEGIIVYYFLDSPGRLLPEDPSIKRAFNPGAGQLPWNGMQYRHASESRSLSRFLQTALAAKVGSVNCKVRGAPLLALSAANMPAVLIEIGNLNNPAEETKLGDPEHLASLAEAIGKGIDNYLNKAHDISSIDLRE